MQNIEKQEMNQELVRPAKKSEKMENSRPFTLPQNFEGSLGQEFHERDDGDSANISQSVTEENQDSKMRKDDPIKTEKQDDKSTHVNCGGVESSMNFKGNLNMTINCSDLKLNTDEKNEGDNKGKPYSVIWISAPTKENAVDVATLLLTGKLVSSVNIMDGVTTMSLKEGKIQTANEVIVKMKTETSLVPEIIRVTDDHFKNKLSINDAEILSTTLKDGNLAYFRYVSENTKDSTLPSLEIKEESDNNLIQHSKQVELEKRVFPNVGVSGQVVESNT